MALFHSQRNRVIVLAGLTGILLAGAWCLPPIAQPGWYHDFADQRTLFGVPNFFNVLSNIPFLLVGLWGIRLVSPRRITLHTPVEYPLWRAFFLCVILIGLGSGYYHLAPDNNTLLWDRLPIALAFATLLAIAAGERISPRMALPLFCLLLPLAILSVVYWWWSEQAGAGDLRGYLLFPIAALLLLPLLYGVFPGRYDRGGEMLIVVALYLLAVLLEWLDAPMHALSNWRLSGHTLKHLFIALSIAWLIHMLRRRRPSSITPPTGY